MRLVVCWGRSLAIIIRPKACSTEATTLALPLGFYYDYYYKQYRQQQSEPIIISHLASRHKQAFSIENAQ